MTNKGKMIETIYTACLTKRATLVIFYLINRASHELTCFPSVGRIAKECNMSTRTVQRALNDLEEAGFLERESRFHERGGQRSNLYKLLKHRVDEFKNINFELLKSDIPESHIHARIESDTDIVSVEDKVNICFKTKRAVLSISMVLNRLKLRLYRLLSWGV